MKKSKVIIFNESQPAYGFIKNLCGSEKYRKCKDYYLFNLINYGIPKGTYEIEFMEITLPIIGEHKIVILKTYCEEDSHDIQRKRNN